MRIPGRRLRVTLAPLLILGAVVTVVTQPSVLPHAASAATIVQGAKDDMRTGWYNDQPELSPGEVASGDFGQIFDHAGINGQVYAQPLVANGVLLVATETNWIYGLDPVDGHQLWARQLVTPYNIASDIGNNEPGGCPDLQPSIGITSTPVVVDNTMYLTAKGYASGTTNSLSNIRYWFFAINITTGANVFVEPIPQAAVNSNSPSEPFYARYQLQRPALLYHDGVIYAGFGGHCDFNEFRGWVVGVSTAGAITTMWTTAASTFSGGGIWQSGSGLMSDGAGRIFVSTGNGVSVGPDPIPETTPPDNCSECVLRLEVQANKSLVAKSFFQPYDEAHLDAIDADFASGGPVELPAGFGTTGADATPAFAKKTIVAVGKEGYVYTLDADNLGGYREGGAAGDKVLDRLGPDGGVWSKPAVWPGDGGWVYIPTAAGNFATSGSAGFLNAYKKATVNGQPSLSRRTNSADADAFGFGSSAPIVTSNGSADGSAVVWMVWMSGGDGTNAELRAYSAVPDGSGQMQLLRSFPVGTASKFNPPGVGAGRIYVAGRDGHVHGFGSPTTSPLIAPTVAFGKVTVGGAPKTLNATLTARVAVSGISVAGITGSGFSNGSPSAASVGAGGTFTVPVTFQPGSTGLRGGTLTLNTSGGQVDVPLNGVGQPNAGTLAGGPTALSFGGTDIGATKTSVVTFANIGAQALTVNSFDLPSAPFTVTDLPANGTVLNGGQTFSVTVSFSPANAMQTNASLVVHSTGGDVTIQLSGASGTASRMSVSTTLVQFGAVQTGESYDATFRVTNTGGNPLTITRSKPPTNAALTVDTPLDEGSSIQPGDFRDLTVTFHPSATGNLPNDSTTRWSLNGDGASSLTDVQFVGTGVNITHPGMTLMRAVQPIRLIDTRTSHGGPGPLNGGATRPVSVAPGVPAGANAQTVVVNVTAVTPLGGGFITVYDCDQSRPTTSNLNFKAGQTTANVTTVTVAGDGTICVFTSAKTDFLVDLTGYASPDEGTRFTPVTPIRFLDTRSPDVHLNAGETRAIAISGKGLPSSFDAVLVNITAVTPSGAGFLTVFPCGTTRPNASNLNYTTGTNVAGLVQTKVGTQSRICVFSSNRTHLLVDVEGFFRGLDGSGLQSIAPHRALDTRTSGGPITGGTTRQISAAALAVPGTSAGVLVNVTAINPVANGFITVYPCGTTRPTTSVLNFTKLTNRANFVSSKLGTGGICVYSSVTTHLAVDTFGEFGSL
jgi:iron transport multicopper oxidase